MKDSEKIGLSLVEENILESYSSVLEKLSLIGKIELLEMIINSIKEKNIDTERRFFESFGFFCSEKSTEEIIMEIKGK